MHNPPGSTPYSVRNLAEASLAFIFAVLKPQSAEEREVHWGEFTLQVQIKHFELKLESELKTN